MVTRWKWFIPAFCALLLTIPVSADETGVVDDAPQVIVNFSQGSIVEDIVNISGYYIDEDLPNTITWNVFDGMESIDSGNLLDTLSQNMDSMETNRITWAFYIELNFSNYGPCSCLLEIQAEDTSNQLDSAQIILFSQSEFESMESHNLPPQIIIENDPGGNRIIGDVEISVVALDDDEDVSEIQWALSNQSEIAMSCIHPRIESPQDIIWNNVTTSLIPSIGESFTLHSNNYEDGSYSLIVRAISTNGSVSVCACETIGIDNNPPIASISGPFAAPESDGYLQFDGSGSSDSIWGRDELVFLWVLQMDSGEQIVSTGKDLRTFDVDSGQSGNYTLTLTVGDNAGFSDSQTHQFEITNLAPNAALKIGGQPLADGDTITLDDSKQWPIECSDSSDTANDQGGLVCTWYIDGDPVMQGHERQMEKPEDLSKPHTLMLEVTDDNGASDTITITFGVQGTPSDPMFSDGDETGVWFQMLGIGAVLSCILIGIFLYTRFNKQSSSIPKWKRE